MSDRKPSWYWEVIPGEGRLLHIVVPTDNGPIDVAIGPEYAKQLAAFILPVRTLEEDEQSRTLR